MKTIRIPIRKMHCRSCELLIEQALLSVPGIKKAKASSGKHEASIQYEGELDMQTVEAAINAAGYEVGENESRKWLSTDPRAYSHLAIGAFIIIFGYFILNALGFSFATGGQTGGGIASALVLGLTAGISTCMALIGGLTLGIAARHAEKHPESSIIQRFRPHLFFNLGRVTGFFILGGALGALGGFFAPGNMTLALITMVVSVFMFILGLQLIEIFPKLSSIKITLPPALGKALGLAGGHTKAYSHRGALITGALTFFLPCGFTQMTQMTAIASGGFWPGALIMAAFAIGTAPGLLGIGGVTSLVRGMYANIFFKTAGLLVIAFAIFNFANGYRLAGFSPFWQSSAPAATETIGSKDPPVVDASGVQVVNMTQSFDGYEPNEFTVKKGVPVKWVITSETTRSCAASISMPDYDIIRYLEEGENVIEFTPEKTGALRFTCGMGMYPGKFTVVE